MLTGVFGAAPSTSGSTNYTHAYTIANTNQHQSLSIRLQDPNINVDFALAMIDKLELSVEPEGIAEYTASFRSKAGVDTTTDVPSFTALGNVFNHSHCVVKLAANTAGLAAASALSLTSLKLNITKNVQDFNDMGSVTLSEIVNKNFVVDGTIELGYSDQVYRDLMLAGSSKAMSITFTYGTNNSLSFTMPKLRFEDWSPKKPTDDIATQSIKLIAQYDAANAASMLSASLKNQVTSY